MGCTEFFGAILLAIGLWTRPAAFALAVLLATITFRVRWDAGYFWKATGWEVTLLLALICLAYLFGGGGTLTAEDVRAAQVETARYIQENCTER